MQVREEQNNLSDSITDPAKKIHEDQMFKLIKDIEILKKDMSAAGITKRKK
jgi:hypothetical protein